MVYTVGEMTRLLDVSASTLRYYDKEGLLPFVERSSGADGILPESALEGFAEYDSADPVDTFVNAIFLYDDKMVLTYNFHESTETITFGELQGIFPNGFRNLDRDLASEPEKTLGREIGRFSFA